MRNIIVITFTLLSFCFASCNSSSQSSQVLSTHHNVEVESVLPITGTFLNLPYQDVRNKYTNPLAMDYTSADFWTAKVGEMSRMGMEYLVLMAVANEGQSYYPSKLMPGIHSMSARYTMWFSTTTSSSVVTGTISDTSTRDSLSGLRTTLRMSLPAQQLLYPFISRQL